MLVVFFGSVCTLSVDKASVQSVMRGSEPVTTHASVLARMHACLLAVLFLHDHYTLAYHIYKIRFHSMVNPNKCLSTNYIITPRRMHVLHAQLTATVDIQRSMRAALVAHA